MRKPKSKSKPEIDPKEPIGCRWIEGDTGPGGHWRYCQAKQQEGSAYCPEHHTRVYVPRKAKGAGKDGDIRAA
jgi:hypothetical protein